MTKKKVLAYPRAFVHTTSTGCWSLSWRDHPDHGNHWDAGMYDAPIYPPSSLSQAHDKAADRVRERWITLGRGDQS